MMVPTDSLGPMRLGQEAVKKNKSLVEKRGCCKAAFRGADRPKRC